MGNKSSTQCTPFARLMSDRTDTSEQKFMDFSHRMHRADSIWPREGCTATKALRGLVERQTGRITKSDEILLQHIAALVRERDVKSHVQNTQRVARVKRHSAVLRSDKPSVYDTSDISDSEEVIFLAQSGATAHALPDVDNKSKEAAEYSKCTSLEKQIASLRSQYNESERRLKHQTYACTHCDDSELKMNRELHKQAENEFRAIRQKLKELNKELTDMHEARKSQLPVRTIPIGEGTVERKMHRTFTPPEILALKQGFPDLSSDAHRFDDWLDQTVALYQCNHTDIEQLAIGVMPWTLSQAVRDDILWTSGNAAQRVALLKTKVREIYPIIRDWAKIAEVQPRENETPLEFLTRFRPIFYLHSGIPAASAEIPLASHFLAAWPDKVVHKLKSNTPDWQHKNVSEICTLLTHFKRVMSDKSARVARVARRQAPVYTNNTTSSQETPRPQTGPSHQHHASLYPSLEDDEGEVCYNCGGRGHWRGVCPTRSTKRGPGSRGRGRGRGARGRAT